MTPKYSQRRRRQWETLIRFTKEKIERSRVKTSQLEAILEGFRTQAKAGAPCPTDVDALSKALH